ncbi:hypothetical protein Tco_1393278 [Tanacetum coccineum]
METLRCVIAELFLEGQPLFELSQLLTYRRGQYDPSQHLEKYLKEAGWADAGCVTACTQPRRLGVQMLVMNKMQLVVE